MRLRPPLWRHVTQSRRLHHAPAAVAFVATLAAAACPAWAQPSAGAPASAGSEAQARQALEARRARDPAWQQLNRAVASLRQAYARRGGESFDAASQRITGARGGEFEALLREWGNDAATTRSMQGISGGAQVQMAMQSDPNLSLSGLNRAQRESMVGGVVGGLGMSIRADAAAERATLIWSTRIVESMSREPGLDPGLAAQARVHADSAAELADYGQDTVDQDVTRMERRIEQTGAVSDLTDALEGAGVFRDDRSRDPFQVRIGELILEIGTDGSVRYSGPGPDGSLVGGYFEPGRDGLPSAGAIRDLENYLPQIPGGALALSQFRRELERLKRRAGGGAGAAGGSGEGRSSVVEGDLPPDAADDQLRLMLQRLRAAAIDLRLSNGGPPFIVRQFLAGGRVLEVIELADIYAGYHLDRAPFIVRAGPSAVATALSTVRVTPSSAGTSMSSVGSSLSSMGSSPSSAGTSLSSLGQSMSAAGTSLSAVGTSLSAAGTSTGSAVWTSPDFWRPTGMSSASDWTDPARRAAPWSRPDPRDLPAELCGR